MTFLDNNDALFLFGNNNNNPYAFRLFNRLMRQYYDSNGNPIKQLQQTNENENREIVSSVQPTNTNTNRTTGKRDTLTLDLLLPKSKSNKPLTSSYSYPSYRMKEAEEEVLASERQGKGSSKDNFDIRDYISRVYDYHNRQQQGPQQNNSNNKKDNKLTLDMLPRPGGGSRIKTFIKGSNGY
jgi:hypothetical protein